MSNFLEPRNGLVQNGPYLDVSFGPSANQAVPGNAVPGPYPIDSTGATPGQALAFNGTKFAAGVARGDAGAAGTSGTVNQPAGTFTLTGTTFTLTNSLITASSLVIVQCITASPGAYITDAVPGSSSLTVTFSTSVTSIKCMFFLVA